MKRSEMVEFMVQNWVGLFNEIPEGVEDEIRENMGKLLDTLVHKGMYPPGYKNPNWGSWNCHDENFWIYEWVEE